MTCVLLYLGEVGFSDMDFRGYEKAKVAREHSFGQKMAEICGS